MNERSTEKQPIPVTRSLLPERDELVVLLDRVLSSGWLTNEGPLSDELEWALRDYIKAHYISLCSNGTIALMFVIHLAQLQGKPVITTPFSYVATTSSLLWEKCTPIFADIDEETLCIDPKCVENLLSDDVAGILPVHIFGNACDVARLKIIGKENKLPIIYDAAQAFGTKINGESLLNYGDYSTLSFHATKVFNTAEGGAIISHSPKDYEHIKLLRAFGHRQDLHYALGINGKMSELHAAFGLAVLGKVDQNIQERKCVSEIYDSSLPTSGFRRPKLAEGLEYNYSYYPIILDDKKVMEPMLNELYANKIYPRRYFYPALNLLPYIRQYHSCPVAEDMALRTLALPLYAGLQGKDIELIATIVKKHAC